jgi:hypothetical protein
MPIYIYKYNKYTYDYFYICMYTLQKYIYIYEYTYIHIYSYEGKSPLQWGMFRRKIVGVIRVGVRICTFVHIYAYVFTFRCLCLNFSSLLMCSPKQGLFIPGSKFY